MSELRVFIPLTSNSKIFDDALDLALTTTADSLSCDEREDCYLVFSSYCGIKYRGGRPKLEMKVRCRDQQQDIFIENWIKTKLKDKSKMKRKAKIRIVDFKELILATVESAGYNDDRILNSELLERQYFVQVRKKRRCILTGDLRHECCRLTDVRSVSLSLSLPSSSAIASEKEWATFCIEGNSHEIMDYLESQFSRSAVGNLCRVALDLQLQRHSCGDSCPENSDAMPFVGGYPQWVRVVSGVSSADERSRLHQQFDAFVTEFASSWTLSAATAAQSVSTITNIHRKS